MKETQSWFFERVKKIKLPAEQLRKKEMSSMRNERGDITLQTPKI